MFTFKKNQVEISGELFDIKELSAGGFRKFNACIKEHPEDEMLQMGTLLSVGVEQFAGQSVDEILDQLPINVITELVPLIIETSGLNEDEDEKKD